MRLIVFCLICKVLHRLDQLRRHSAELSRALANTSRVALLDFARQRCLVMQDTRTGNASVCLLRQGHRIYATKALATGLARGDASWTVLVSGKVTQGSRKRAAQVASSRNAGTDTNLGGACLPYFFGLGVTLDTLRAIALLVAGGKGL